MDKARRFRHHSKDTKPKSVDGFISANRFKQSSGSIGFPESKKGKPIEANLLVDDFSRPDGYHSSNDDVTGQASSEPLLPEGPRKPISQNSGLNKPPKRRGWRRIFHRPKSWKQSFKRAGLIAGALLLLIVGYLGVKFYLAQRHILKGGGNAPAIAVCTGDGNVPIDTLKTEGDGRINIMILGIGGPGHEGPNLTDTILIASIDPVNHKADLVSIPRDTWVSIPKMGYQKINAAYEAGLKNPYYDKPKTDDIKNGIKSADQVIGGIAGVKIHYHVLVDFKAFRDAVNAVNGVTVNVPDTLYDPTIAWANNWNPVIARKGTVTMKGDQALLYARSRETSTDFARSERQRALLVALKEKVLSLGTFSNPLKISSLLDSFGNNVYTDFDINTIKCLYKQGSEIPSSNIKSLDMVTPPHDLLTTGNIGGLSVVYPKAGIYDFSAIRNFIRSTLKDSFLAKENATVTVLNGTSTAGLATKEANILKMYGYNLGKVGDAPTKNYQQTVLIDLSDGQDKYTKHYLENRLNVKAVTKLPDSNISAGSANFVIILGNDAINNLKN